MVDGPVQSSARMTAGYTLAERELLRAVRDLVRADRDMRRRLGASMHMNLTVLQALRHVIDAQDAEGFTTPRRLADTLGISTASTTTLIDRLVTSGHLVRSPHPRDRRSVVVTATPHAREEVREHLGDMHERMRHLAAAVPPEARPPLITFLRALTDEMEHGLLDIGGSPAT